MRFPPSLSDLVLAVVLLVMARWILHLGGVWNIASLDRWAERSLLARFALPVASPQLLVASSDSRLKPLLIWLFRVLAGVAAIVLGTLAVAAILHAFR